MQYQLPTFTAMLQQLVAIPSVSSTVEKLDQSNKPIIDLLADWCETLGMEVELMPVDDACRKWNLLAKIGTGTGGLGLAGHTDTVPYDSGAWQSDPFVCTERDQRWYGLGVCDMKCFFPIILQVLAESRDYLNKPVTLIATADEESAMSGARLLQQRQQSLGDYVLIGEPTGLRPIRQHKGIMMEEIQVLGQSGHSSQPKLGRNAMEAMTDVILELRALRARWAERYRNPGFSVPIPTLNLGCIHGGDNPNRICKSCDLQFDIRVMPGMEVPQIRAEIESCLQPIAVRHDLSIRLNTLFDGVGSFSQDDASPFVRLCEELTGQPSGSVAFATEAPFFKALGADTLVLGPGDIAQAHQPDEYLAMNRVDPMLAIVRKLVKTLCLQ